MLCAGGHPSILKTSDISRSWGTQGHVNIQRYFERGPTRAKDSAGTVVLISQVCISRYAIEQGALIDTPDLHRYNIRLIV